MEYKNCDIEKNIKVLAAAAGLSVAEVARRVGDSPQAFNNKMKNGKIQKDLDFLAAVASACGYNFEWNFSKKEE